MKAPRISSLLALVLALLLAGCSSDNKVGEDVDLSIGNQVEQERLGQNTTTVAPPTTAPGAEGQGAIGRATTTAPTAPPSTEAPKAQFFEIGIHADNSGTSQFDPPGAAVGKGVTVRWTNRDTVARSVEADEGAFNSGLIPPGGTFLWKADKTGAFNYSDGTRPYAVGRIEVRG